VSVLLDANALLAVLVAEPAMDRVLSLIRQGNTAMTGANIAEVFDVGVRRKGLSPARMTELVEPLFEGPIACVPLDQGPAGPAGVLRGERYHRSKCRISLADAILLAAARPTDKIATSDSEVLSIAAELGVETIELPPSSG
jgi:PIN domain nuclease of toxin-antitoxin system